MKLIELQCCLRQLRLGGMASVLETRLRQAQAEPMAPIELLSVLRSVDKSSRDTYDGLPLNVRSRTCIYRCSLTDRSASSPRIGSE